MMMKSFFSPLISASLSTVLVLFSLTNTFAQVMQSSNYQIQSDSINIGGGFSTSSSYTLESTVGEIATGNSESDSFNLRAGYLQMQEVFISLTGANSVALTPAIPGVTGGTSNGSTTVTVITDSPSGYSLTISAASAPAMVKGLDSIADYAPEGSDPDFAFNTGAADSHFGFSPEGVDIVNRFKDNGSVCNSGALDTSFSCWDGLSTEETIVSSNTNPNHPTGATTTIQFRVGVGGAVAQEPGIYTATTTLTALPL